MDDFLHYLFCQIISLFVSWYKALSVGMKTVFAPQNILRVIRDYHLVGFTASYLYFHFIIKPKLKKWIKKKKDEEKDEE